MSFKIVGSLSLILLSFTTYSQDHIKAFFYVEPDNKELPVFVRGNLGSGKILLFVQGGDAENGIDFGRSDYPGWKNTLEKHVALAYYDLRGLNRPVKKIDTTFVNSDQVVEDIMLVAESLADRYGAEIHLMGHSLGGVRVLKCLYRFRNQKSVIQSAIILNAPMTTDFSPERYTYYRPLYLKNLATEKITQNENRAYWQEARTWMDEVDFITNISDSKIWNSYVDEAFEPTKKRIGLGMVVKTVFAKPYNPLSYWKGKDNKFIGDRLWYAEKALWDSGKQMTTWEVLPEINYPVLLITGRYDAIAVPEEQEVADSLLKCSELKVLPDCGHEAFIDQPKLLSSIISDYLDSH